MRPWFSYRQVVGKFPVLASVDACMVSVAWLCRRLKLSCAWPGAHESVDACGCFPVKVQRCVSVGVFERCTVVKITIA